jgi:hypothetical protein
MSSYITNDEFEKWVVGDNIAAICHDLTESEKDELVARIIKVASGDLDGYAKPVYSLPLSATDQVKGIVFDLAWYLFCRRRDYNYTEFVQAAEKELRKKLEQMKKGGYHLTDQKPAGSVDDRTSARPTSPAARATGREQRFGKEKGLKDF